MTHLRSMALAAIAAVALASAALAQTGSSPGASTGGVNPGGPSSGAPRPGTVNPSADRLPGSAANTPAPTPSTVAPTPVPSVSQGTSMSRGTDDATATPEDRAACASLSSTSRADCVADMRKQREARESGGAGRGRM